MLQVSPPVSNFTWTKPHLAVDQDNPPQRKPGILVVDDKPLVRDLLQKALERYGFQVWAVADGWQALALYEHLGEAVSLVLLDVRMPGLDGPQTLAALQRLNPEIRCCFMSGDTGPYNVADLLEQGAARVFAKPFRLDEVVQALRHLTSDRVRARQACLAAC